MAKKPTQPFPGMARGPHRAAMPRASAPAGRHWGKGRRRAGAKAASCFGPQWRKWQQQTTTGRPTAVRRARTARLALQNGPGRAAKRHTVVAVVRGAWNVCFVPPRCSPPFSTALFCANDAMQPFTAFGRHRPILRDAARQLRLHDDRLLPLKSVRCGNLAVCEKNLLQDGILPFCIYIRLCHPSRLSQRFAANVRNIG